MAELTYTKHVVEEGKDVIIEDKCDSDILLSFLFYIPVAVAAGLLPILGMLMLPKTVCYILMIACFLREARKGTQ